jgi:hypothetical protein
LLLSLRVAPMHVVYRLGRRRDLWGKTKDGVHNTNIIINCTRVSGHHVTATNAGETLLSVLPRQTEPEVEAQQLLLHKMTGNRCKRVYYILFFARGLVNRKCTEEPLGS